MCACQGCGWIRVSVGEDQRLWLGAARHASGEWPRLGLGVDPAPGHTPVHGPGDVCAAGRKGLCEGKESTRDTRFCCDPGVRTYVELANSDLELR